MKTISKNIVYLGIGLIIFKYNITFSVIKLLPELSTMLMIIGILCFLPNMISQSYSKKQFIFLIICLMYALINLKNNGDDLILIIVIFGWGLKNIDRHKMLDVYFITTSICFIFIILYSLYTGKGLVLSAAYREENIFVTRYTLGFSHPNSLQGTYLRIVTSFVLSSFCKKNRKRKYFILELINIYLFYLSNSRAGFIVSSLVLLLSFMEDSVVKFLKTKVFCNVMLGSIVSVVLFTVYATYNYYKNSFLILINQAITGRFQHAYKFTSRYSVTLLGTDISALSKIFTLDCGIISTLLNYGIVGFLIALFVYLYGVKKMWEKKEYTNIIVVLCCVIYSVIESIYVNPFVNIGLLTCMYSCINYRNTNIKESESV